MATRFVNVDRNTPMLLPPDLRDWVPADPRSTPAHIRPEWYFLAVYQYLKLPPQEFLGISGKTMGVLSQGPFILALILLPF